jgi:phage I-like protein
VQLVRPQLTLSIAITGDEPPSEFRIFRAGANETKKGTFVFDDVAASRVMAEYETHGIDLMVDYDHASLSAQCAVDPANAGKAAAWFNLELRGGELGAVNVRWTPLAADALRRKEWRFMSPAFSADSERRVTSLLNVAITNLPATRRLEPLMAANTTTTLGGAMTLEELMKVAEALELGPEATLDDFMAKIGALKDMAAQKPAEEPPIEAPAEMADKPAEEPKEEEAAVMAASSRLIRLTGKATIVAAVDEVEVWRTSHIELETERQKLAAERATLESAERRKLCVELVGLGAEFPSTVWSDPLENDGKPSTLKSRWTSMQLVELRAHVAEQRAARGGKGPATAKGIPVVASVGGSKVFETPHGTVTLSAQELRNCEEAKADPKVYAANKAIQQAARKRTARS